MSTNSVTAYPGTYATPSARRTAAGESGFSVPESALRRESPADPVRDSVELSRYYPQLVIPQTYAPAPAARLQTSSLPEDGTADNTAFMNALGGEASGAQTREAVEEGHSIASEEEEEEGDGTAESGEAGSDGEKLSEDEQNEVRQLANRDREVRAHEQAHMAAGGQYAGGVSYEYQQGPDGQRYAVGGEVSIDASAERDPAATIRKMQQVKAAALAPGQPSGQDRSVAAQASATEAQARTELAAQSRTEAAGGGEENADGEGNADASTASSAEASRSGAPSGSRSDTPNAAIGASGFGASAAGLAFAGFAGSSPRHIDVVA